MPDKIFIDSNVVIYAITQASSKAHLCLCKHPVKTTA